METGDVKVKVIAARTHARDRRCETGERMDVGVGREREGTAIMETIRGH